MPALLSCQGGVGGRGGWDRDGRKMEKYDFWSSLPTHSVGGDTHAEYPGPESPKSAGNSIRPTSGLDSEEKIMN